jgi:hypothetical protein
MTSILSTISGYFSKPLILSAFLPVVIFILLSWLFLVPILPDYVVFQPLEGLEKEWKLLAVSFIAIVASGLIYNLNIQILRFYEGYPWRDSWIGRLRKTRYEREFDRTEARIFGLRTLLRAMDRAREENNGALMQATIDSLEQNGVCLGEIETGDKQWWKIWFDGPDYEATLVKERWDRIKKLVLDEFTKTLGRFRREFPQEKWLIMPTRLGNVIRGFEYYPRREYGIDGAEMWPRLIAEVDKEYATVIDDAKISCDFFITSSMLSGVLSAAFIVVAFMRPVAITGRAMLFTTIGKSVVFGLLAYALYLLAIPRANEWGKMVKSAFDIYRWKLLSQLGYKQELTSRSAERELWKEISRQTIYGDSFVKPAPLDYTDPAPASPSVAHAGPSTLQLEISRGVQLAEQTNRLKIFLRIKNTDAEKAVQKIVITDKLPDGLHYEWGTVASDLGDVVISGSNPYRFALNGQLGMNQSVEITYQAISLTSNQKHNVGLRFGNA